jgi:hypothetical protein
MKIADDLHDDAGGPEEEPDSERFYIWTTTVIVWGSPTLVTSTNRSGPFCGRAWCHDIASSFASKPGVLAVSIEPVEARANSGGAAEEANNVAERAGWLLKAVARDHSCAPWAKAELERLGVWQQYEDRFLDLFSKKTTDN